MNNIDRKIPKNLENPIDNLIIFVGKKFYRIFRKLRFTPNNLTFISMILGFISIYLFYIQNYILSSIIYFISYCFDVFDGNYARTYNMVTEFGDLFDHVKDIAINVIFFIFFIKFTTLQNYKIYILITAILLILMCVHLGCQEQYVKTKDSKNTSEYLKSLGTICNKNNAVNNMTILRYFGCGTFALWVSFVIILHTF
jgi:phosphatidylglycerophosphate synthase